MKKVLLTILIVGIIFTSSCARPNNIPNTSNQGSNASNVKTSEQVDLTNNITVDNATDVETEGNSYFFKYNILGLDYKGSFLFYDFIEQEVNLNINEVANLKYGKLYELKLDSIDGVPNERLSLGYFYVMEEKIYKIEPTQENLNKLKMSGELPDGSVIVCQEKEIKDTLGNDEHGWHHYLEANGDKREFHSYNNQVSTGYYESFTWEKGKGLIHYRSGFGAERDSIELQLDID